MIFLFRSGTVREKLALIFRATRTHAQNLAKYASVYKLTMLLLKHLGGTPGKEGPYDTFVAGLVGGYLVFGRRSKRGHVSSVSKQIVIFGRSPFLSLSSLFPISCAGSFVLMNGCSLCTSLSLSSRTLHQAQRGHNQIRRALETDITRCVACLCGAELGLRYVAL